MLVLWVARCRLPRAVGVSGFGGRMRTEPFQDRHYALVRWFLSQLYRVATRAFGLRLEIEEPAATDDELSRRLTRPVVVLSRHAGPGDSFLLVYQLLRLYQRRPRIVMKAALQFDPGLDVVINRLPHAFVYARRAGEGLVIEEILGSRWTRPAGRVGDLPGGGLARRIRAIGAGGPYFAEATGRGMEPVARPAVRPRPSTHAAG
jgi:hypothetical protein